MKILPIVVLVLFMLRPAVHAQGTAAPDLDKIIAQFVEFFNARDLTKLASLYADDAVWMPQNEPMIKSRAAIEAAVNLDALQTAFAEVHRDHPFHEPPDFVAALRSLIDSANFKSTLEWSDCHQ